MNAFDLAARQLGMNENDQRAALTDYMTTGGVNLDPAMTAWCAAYMNSTLAQTGQEGTGSNMARSFLEWGEGVDQPQQGDVVVMSRGDPTGPYGHVGFFAGYNEDGTIRVLGGNQGDAVSYANYDPASVLGYRRGTGGASGGAAPAMAAGPFSLPGAAPAPKSMGEVFTSAFAPAAAPSAPAARPALPKAGNVMGAGRDQLTSLLDEVQTASSRPKLSLPQMLGKPA